MGGNLRGGYSFRAGDLFQADLRLPREPFAAFTNALSWSNLEQSVGVKLNIGGVVRVSYTLKILDSGGGRVGYGRITKNGVAVGTVRSTTVTYNTTFIEDIVVQKGDVLRLQGYQNINTGTNGVYFEVARILAVNPTDEIV